MQQLRLPCALHRAKIHRHTLGPNTSKIRRNSASIVMTDKKKDLQNQREARFRVRPACEPFGIFPYGAVGAVVGRERYRQGGSGDARPDCREGHVAEGEGGVLEPGARERVCADSGAGELDIAVHAVARCECVHQRVDRVVVAVVVEEDFFELWLESECVHQSEDGWSAVRTWLICRWPGRTYSCRASRRCGKVANVQALNELRFAGQLWTFAVRELAELFSRDDNRVEFVQDRECFIVDKSIHEQDTSQFLLRFPFWLAVELDRCIEAKSVSVDHDSNLRR